MFIYLYLSERSSDLWNVIKELFTRLEIDHCQLCSVSANDAKERQDWINKLRSVAEFHTSSIAEVHKSKF